ncbi:MAG: SAM hydroxide adenosyltransferase [Thermotogota bacterium]|nr:SAM hydroxide adenosyltransferase [Thermotogota bacterium]
MFKKLGLLGLVLVFAAVVLAQVTGTVAEVDKYGNVHTNILETTVEEAGFELGDMLEVRLDGEVIEAPFVTTYGDVDTGNPLVRITGDHVLLAINYGNFSKTYGLEVGDEVEISILVEGAYKKELELRHLVRTDDRDDYKSDAVFANFREVTIGYIKPGTLYRSSHPAIDDPRAPYANELCEEAGINTVINLSDSVEELQTACEISDFYKSLNEKGQVINLNMGVDLASDKFAHNLREGSLFLINNEPPYLIHCVEGKDRAGITVAILGALMRGTVEEIYEDYAQSYVNYYHVKPGTDAYEAVVGIIEGILENISGGKEITNDNVNTIAFNYLRDKVGLTFDEILKLQEKLYY